jgi:hypothetical protein
LQYLVSVSELLVNTFGECHEQNRHKYVVCSGSQLKVAYNKTHRSRVRLIAEGNSQLLATLLTSLHSSELLTNLYMIHALVVFICNDYI